jgi:hypothetical protein
MADETSLTDRKAKRVRAAMIKLGHALVDTPEHDFTLVIDEFLHMAEDSSLALLYDIMTEAKDA